MRNIYFKNIDKILSISIIVFLVIIIVANYLFYSHIYAVDFDGGWNATVARNFALYGKYMVSQPSNILYHPVISTGEPVILLVAMVFKLFGISDFTTTIIPTIFYILSFALAGLIFTRNLKYSAIAVIIWSIIFLSNPLLYRISLDLLGEYTSLFSILLSMFLIQLCFENKNNNSQNRIMYFIAGSLIAISILSKIIIIFFAVSILVLLFIDSLTYKNLSVRQYFVIVLGFVITFLSFFILRLSQFDYNFQKAVDSIIAYIAEMFSQSKSLNLTNDFDVETTFIGRVNHFASLIGIIPFPLVTIFVPSVALLIKWGTDICKFYKHKLIKNIKYIYIYIYILISASSVFVYYLFFGSSAFLYRRLIVYNVMFIIYYLLCIFSFLESQFISKLFNNNFKNKLIIILLIIICFRPLTRIDYNFLTSWYRFNKNAVSDMRTAESEMIEVVKSLPEDSTIYSLEIIPELELFCNIIPLDFYKTTKDTVFGKNTYIVTGGILHYRGMNIREYLEYLGYNMNELTTYDTRSMNIAQFFSFKDVDLYSVYEIQKK